MDLVDVANPFPSPRRICDPDWGAIAPRVDEPSAANCDPMASNDQKPRLFKVPIGPLALPGCKGGRIAAEISNELHVMIEVAKCMLQFVGVRAANLPAIVPMSLNYLDHLVDIGSNEGRHRDWSTIQPAPRGAGLHVPQGRARLNWSPALRLRFGLVSLNSIAPRLHPVYEPCCRWQWDRMQSRYRTTGHGHRCHNR